MQLHAEGAYVPPKRNVKRKMTMTNQEIENQIFALHRNDIWTLARLKAIQQTMVENLSPEELKAWMKKVDLAMNLHLQELLEDIENKYPGWAARIDNRKPDELEGVG
jgi:hypothetical protein